MLVSLFRKVFMWNFILSTVVMVLLLVLLYFFGLYHSYASVRKSMAIYTSLVFVSLDLDEIATRKEDEDYIKYLSMNLDKFRRYSGAKYVYIFNVFHEGSTFGNKVKYIADADFNVLGERDWVRAETWSIDIFQLRYEKIDINGHTVLVTHDTYYEDTYEDTYGELYSSYIRLYDNTYLGLDFDAKLITSNTIDTFIFIAVFVVMINASLVLFTSLLFKAHLSRLVQHRLKRIKKG